MPCLKRRSKRSQSRKSAPPTAPDNSSSDQLPNSSRHELSRKRRWLFRGLALLLPLFLLGALEGVLRVAGYGYSTAFFKKARIQNQEFYVQNDDVALRFFPPETARNPGPIRMSIHKPPGTYRVFIFGESAAMGDPEPAYGAGRYMETLLRERFPETKFEVINTAFTAINSHVILPIARECADHEGDLWIIYMGNNEMVGPFGAATVFGAKAPPLAFVRMSVAIQRFRIGQLLMSLVRKLSAKSAANSSWGGMQMFLQNQVAPTDTRKNSVYHHFQSNLEGILGAAQSSGCRVLLSRVAVNLKDCPPFAAVINSNLPAADRTRLEQLFAQARQAQAGLDLTNAIQLFEQVSKLDPSFAEAFFRLAQVELAQGRTNDARAHFQAACDLDALPFRADTRINSLIGESAKNAKTTNLVLLDANAALQSASPIGIPGDECFYEHVHFNFQGNYRLGLSWAQQVEQALPASLKTHATTDWADQKECDRRLGLSDWNRSFVLESVIRRLQQPPLSGQFNNAGRLESYRKQLQTLRGRMTPEAAGRVHTEFANEVQRHPDDFSLREGFADFLEATGAFHEAELQWGEVQRLIPQDFLASYQLGRMCAKQNKLDNATSALRQAIAIRPGFAEAWIELGRVQATEEKFDLSLASFEHACLLRPQDPVAISYKAKVLSRLARRSEAIALYRHAIELNPNYWEAHNSLADDLASDGQSAEAAREYEIVTRLNPDYPMAHLNLGVMHVKMGNPTEGARQFEETLRLQPSNKTAREYLDRVKNRNP